MPTRHVLLPMSGVVLPDDQAAGNRPPAPRRRKSTAAAPSPHWLEWLFDDAQAEQVMWAFILPGNWQSGGTLRLKYSMASATSGNVVWAARAVPITDESTNINTAAFNDEVTTTSAVAGTLHQVKEATIALNTTGFDANRLVCVTVRRLGADGSDTATGDAVLEGATLEYEGL